MKTLGALLSLAWLLAVLPASGQEATPTPAPPPMALIYASAPFHAYGGDPLTLPVTAQAPLGTHLRIYANVYQEAGSIAVPWQSHTPVGEEIVFGDRTSTTIDCALPALRVVQRKTRVSVTLHIEPKPTAASVGLMIRGFVYPREEPGAWQKQFAALLARSGIRRVAVFGGGPNSRDFLRGRKVAFDDLGDDWPGEVDAHTLYLGSVTAKTNESAALSIPGAFGETPGARLILFAPWDTEVFPPGVYQTVGTAGGGVWKVTLPDLFAGAVLNHPQDLETLTAIFQQVLPSRQPAGDNPEPTTTP